MSPNPAVLEYLLKYPSEEELFREYFQRIEAPFTELITLSWDWRIFIIYQFMLINHGSIFLTLFTILSNSLMHICILVVLPSLTLRSHVFTMKYSSTSGMNIYIYTYTLTHVRSIIFFIYWHDLLFEHDQFLFLLKEQWFLMNRD